MPAATKRSAAARSMYPCDHTIPRVSDNTKVVKLDPPPRIQEDERKLDAWNYICTDLASRQLLSPSYIMPITMLVDNIILYNELVVQLAEIGNLIPTLSKDGTAIVAYKENPLFSMTIRIMAAINKQCEKFGLNPRDSVYTTNPDLKTVVAEEKAQALIKGPVYFNN